MNLKFVLLILSKYSKIDMFLETLNLLFFCKKTHRFSEIIFCQVPLIVFDTVYRVHFLLKSVPLQARSCPEGSRKLRFPDYVTMIQDGGKVVSLKHRPPLPHVIVLVLISVRG